MDSMAVSGFLFQQSCPSSFFFFFTSSFRPVSLSFCFSLLRSFFLFSFYFFPFFLSFVLSVLLSFFLSCLLFVHFCCCWSISLVCRFHFVDIVLICVEVFSYLSLVLCFCCPLDSTDRLDPIVSSQCAVRHCHTRRYLPLHTPPPHTRQLPTIMAIRLTRVNVGTSPHVWPFGTNRCVVTGEGSGVSLAQTDVSSLGGGRGFRLRGTVMRCCHSELAVCRWTKRDCDEVLSLRAGGMPVD